MIMMRRQQQQQQRMVKPTNIMLCEINILSRQQEPSSRRFRSSRRYSSCCIPQLQQHHQQQQLLQMIKPMLLLLLFLHSLSSSSSSTGRILFASACNFYYSMSCPGGSSYAAAIIVTIDATESYEADVTYHWTNANSYLGTLSLSGEETLPEETFVYDEPGVYYAGATIKWGANTGCEGSVSDSFSKITFTESTCSMEDGVTPPDDLVDTNMTREPGNNGGGNNNTPAPSMGETSSLLEMTDSPTRSPPTPPPTAKPIIMTPLPTRRPPTMEPVVVEIPTTPAPIILSLSPNTISPTEGETIENSPSGGSNSPTLLTTSPVLPTSPPFTDITECGNDICESSEDSVSCTLDCRRIEWIVNVNDPPEEEEEDSSSSSSRIVVPEGVYWVMKSNRDVIVTDMNIYPKGLENGIITVYARRGLVGYKTLMANTGNIIYSSSNSAQSSSSTLMEEGISIPLELSMQEQSITSIFIHAVNDGVQCWTRSSKGGGDGIQNNGILSIESGVSVDEEEDDDTLPIYFRGSFRYDVVNSMTPYPTLSPSYTYPPTFAGGGFGGGPEPSSVIVDKTESSDNNNSQTLIIAGAAAGACGVILTLAVGMFFVRKKKRQDVLSSKKNIHDDDVRPDRVGLEIETQSETLYQQQPQSYFGTIHKKEGECDDISTLGDPYMGDAANARMDADYTVGESMISNQQQLYIYGVGKPGANTGTASRMGDTTVFSGSKVMMFGEDTALEDIYQTPTPNGDSTLDLITVSAPAGPLGIVLDNPHGALPYVYAIKETSSLNGRVRVGDLLLSVDEVDCRGMSSHTITRFLSSRSSNLERKLVLARGTGMDHDGSTASAV